MKFLSMASLALLGSAHAATVPKPPSSSLSHFQELSFGAPQDVLAGDYINMWFRLTIGQFQAPHGAFTEDAWVAYGTGRCHSDNLCASFHTCLSRFSFPIDRLFLKLMGCGLAECV